MNGNGKRVRQTQVVGYERKLLLNVNNFDEGSSFGGDIKNIKTKIVEQNFKDRKFTTHLF